MIVMRLPGAVTAFVISLTLSAAPLPWPVTYSGSSRFTALDVAVDGEHVWTAGSWGVRLQRTGADGLDPGTTIGVPGHTTRIVAAQGRAWAASGTRIVAISASPTPVIEGMVEVGVEINDLLLDAPYLYAATQNGIIQLDLLQPSIPAVLRTLATSSGGALSLAKSGRHLFAADGDLSVEIYDIGFPSLPQGVGSFAVFPRTTAVGIAGDLLIASDGRQSRIFTAGGSPSLIGRITSGADAVRLISPGIVAASEGRELWIRDLRNPANPLLLWSTSSPVTAGSVNRIENLAMAEGLLIAAAGDAGVITFDVSGFSEPWATVAYQTPPLGSVAAGGDLVLSARAEGGLTLWRRTAAGLEKLHDFGENVSWTAADADGSRLLAFSGARLTLWSAGSGAPALEGETQLDSSVRDAVLVGTTAWAVLDDGSGARVDFSATPAALSAWETGVPAPYALARRDGAVAVAGMADGQTMVRIYSEGESVGDAVSFSGVATSGIAIDSTRRIAALTFSGLHLIDAITGSSTVVPDVDPVLAIVYSGERVVLLRRDHLEVRDSAHGSLVSRIGLPAAADSAAALSEHGEVAVAGETALTLIRPQSADRQPSFAGSVEQNRYPLDVQVDGSWAHVRELERFVRYQITSSGTLSPVAAVTVPQGTVSIAAVGREIVLLSSAGVVTKMEWSGRVLGSAPLEEVPGLVPLDLHAVAGAVWVSSRRGCSAGSCEKRTDVLDPGTLRFTASMTGGITDVTVSGSTAWAVTDLPGEVRRIDVRDPLSPVIAAARGVDGDPVSVAHDPAGDRLWLLGQRLQWLEPLSLQPLGEWLESWRPHPRLSYNQQRIRSGPGGLAIVGRWFAPRIWPGGDPPIAPLVWDTPAAARAIAAARDGWLLVTDASIEVAMTPEESRRRGIRR